jgi:sulfonate transport system ATP-binding protein
LNERIVIPTNKPTTIYTFLEDNRQRKKDIPSDEFVKLKMQITDLLTWW